MLAQGKPEDVESGGCQIDPKVDNADVERSDGGSCQDFLFRVIRGY